jgi:hypothetical protein
MGTDTPPMRLEDLCAGAMVASRGRRVEAAA